MSTDYMTIDWPNHKIDWTQDSEYIRLFGPAENDTIVDENSRNEERYAPRPPMSPFGEKIDEEFSSS